MVAVDFVHVDAILLKRVLSEMDVGYQEIRLADRAGRRATM